ncbi:hypothetical protein OE88DRAFT_1722752 [Heliocybe sulcata]|uniref:AAA+ ATPase domain-containing protein n=1 Tax=Heliocybe sulcata TaxID=5364 RepID=A0A5C3NDF3_9AGAM|nr:hypothetical protein OE88DRAFT_1722752 [Heliocybe sulcata]
MTEAKRKAGGKGSKAKAVGSASQKTLLHHFQKKASIVSVEVDNGSASQVEAGSDGGAQVSQESTLSSPSDAEQRTLQTNVDIERGQYGYEINEPSSTVPEPRQLFSIFQKPAALQEDMISKSGSLQSLPTPPIVNIPEEHLQTVAHDVNGSTSSTRLATPISIIDSPPPTTLRMDSPEIIVLNEGGSREDPIVIEQSPVQSRERPPSSKAIFPMFVPRSRDSRFSTPIPTVSAPKAVFPMFAAQMTGGSPVPRSPSRRTKEPEAPLPDADQQHVRGEQTSFHTPGLLLSRRDKGKARAVPEDPPASLPALSIPASKAGPRSQLSSCDTGCEPMFRIEDVKSFSGTIPKSHRNAYSAISRIIDYLEADNRDDPHTRSQLWTDRWRPRHADEVLGNEANALYLRNWLEALALQGDLSVAAEPINSPIGKKRKVRKKTKKSRDEPKAKKPKIQRAVERPKGRGRRRVDSDAEDDWIVSTEDETASESEPDILPSSDGDLEFCRQTLSCLRHKSDASQEASSDPMNLHSEARSDGSEFEDDVPPIPHGAADFTSRLTNTILLTGPSGCGKTAAVYACAEELGWEVFEVYPGIGKRSNTNLESLVGDVGKNHTLRRGVFRKSAGIFAKNEERRPQGGPITVDADEGGSQDQVNLPPREDNGTSSQGRNEVKAMSIHPAAHEDNKIRQSLVLLEEVDVLYKDDQNFWPAVINFIKDCRRPVVMTCNGRCQRAQILIATNLGYMITTDVSLVPLQDLPLQEVLVFAPAPPKIAASYLQSLCLAEEFRIDRRFLTQLYEAPEGREMGLSDPADWSQEEDLQDLRFAINQLQLLCAAAKRSTSQESYSDRNEASEADPADHVPISRGSSQSDAVEDGSADSSDAKAELELLRGLARHAETASFMDGGLSRKAWQTPQALLERERRSSVNDETGHQILFPGSTVSELEVTALYRRDEEIRQWIESRVHDPPTPKTWLDRSKTRGGQSFDTRSLFRARVAHVSHVVAVLRSILPFSFLSTAPALQVFLDYLPWVRHMVATDDEEEARESQIAKPGRRTRNSQRYVRWISLSEEERNTLGCIGL